MHFFKMASSTFVFVLMFSLLAIIVTSVPSNRGIKENLSPYQKPLELDDDNESHERSYDHDGDSYEEHRDSNSRDDGDSDDNSKGSNSRDDDDSDDNSKGSNSRDDDDSDDNSKGSDSRDDDDSDDKSKGSNSRYDDSSNEEHTGSNSKDEDGSDEDHQGSYRRYNDDSNEDHQVSNSRDEDESDVDHQGSYSRDVDDSNEYHRRSFSRDVDDFDVDHRRVYRRYDRYSHYRYHDIAYKIYYYKPDTCHDVCGINAVCVKHNCQCRYGFIGNPRFACHEESTAFCSITNDQSLTTFGREQFSLVPIADVKTAEVTTDRRARGKGECNLQVWTFFNRTEGTMYITELQMKLTISSGYKSTETIFKIIASVENGVYVFKVYYFDGKCFTPFTIDCSDSPFVVTRSFTIRSVQLKFTRVLPGLLLVELNNCGIKFAVRPFNDKNPQLVPGFMIEVDKSFNPTFFPEDVPTLQICLSTNQVNLPKITSFQDDLDSLVLIALTNSEVEPPFNSTPSNLGDLRATLNHCCDEDKLRFVNFYQSVLSKPPFVKAISGGVPGLSELVRFLSLVLKDICGLDANGCDEADDLICQRADKSNLELLKPYCSHYEGKRSENGKGSAL